MGQGAFDLLVLQFFEFQQHFAQVGLDLTGRDAQLSGGLFDVDGSRLGAVEVEGVDVVDLTLLGQQIDL